MSGVADPTGLFEGLGAFEATTLASLDGRLSTLDGMIANQVAKASRTSNNNTEVSACGHDQAVLSALWVDRQNQIDGIKARLAP